MSNCVTGLKKYRKSLTRLGCVNVEIRDSDDAPCYNTIHRKQRPQWLSSFVDDLTEHGSQLDALLNTVSCCYI